MLTGHPCTQVGFLQLRHLWLSVSACSRVRPWFTSSCRLLTRTSGLSSGILTRGIATRSFGEPVKGEIAPPDFPSREETGSSRAALSFTSFEERGRESLAIASASSALYDFIRLIISFQSTSCASNSGPSTQTNLVLPPTVTRHAPHIPVPSTMMVLSEASVGMLYLAVVRATNFIMTAGPMVTHLSTCSRLMTSSTPTVTTPCLPMEPSSVITISSSDH